MTQRSYAQPSAPSDPDTRTIGPDLRTSAPSPPRTALITGGSSGIGAAFADVFAAHGFDLVIAARREDRLREVATRIEGSTGRHVHVIACDLGRRETPQELCREIASRGLTIDALVNNAGYGVPGTLLASPWERHEAMLQVMIGSMTELTYRLLPGMIERVPGDAMPSRRGGHRRQRDDGAGGIAHDRPLSTVAAQGPPEWRRTMLDETSDGLRDVIDADMTQPVRRRSTRRRRRRQRNDLDALTPEVPPEKIAVEHARGLDIDRSELVVTESIRHR